MSFTFPQLCSPNVFIGAALVVVVVFLFAIPILERSARPAAAAPAVSAQSSSFFRGGADFLLGQWCS